ncbi:hypothetical protein H8356DRAFT_1337865 [Neocallimastix lanati (nom. inval.)]|nr:hypothetical protein H8356DRAFT_1337865 [Neocallimastix sp. JGI-2020a]
MYILSVGNVLAPFGKCINVRKIANLVEYIYITQVEYLSTWAHDMYPNASNSLINILNDSTCETLSDPQLGNYLLLYYLGDLE